MVSTRIQIAAAMLAGLAVMPALGGDTTVRDDLSGTDLARVKAVTAPTADFSRPETHEILPGGAATSRKPADANAFTHFSSTLDAPGEERFKLGRALFNKIWVSSPSSSRASDGLGPLFNARACMMCHPKGGRGRPPEGKADATSMFFKLARAASDEEEHRLLAEKRVLALPDPVYGAQLQDFAVPGHKAEGRMAITYTELSVTLGDGTVVSLRKPAYSVVDLAYGPIDPSTVLSPRVAQPMTGLGLIEAIHPADILALADPEDANGDGISGKPNIVRNYITGEAILGRFGWKATNPTVRTQTADAFFHDIGISSPDMPGAFGDCTKAQEFCRKAPHGEQETLGQAEAPETVMELVSFYSSHLAVPERRAADETQVLRGKALFYGAGCASCHRPKFVTRRDAADKALAFQLIWPYSDFLLHDMGVGLADWLVAGDARGAEWRTPPLWGIGLTQTVSGHTFFLHDGRARNLTEAILWHGGEGQATRDKFAAMPAQDRAALIRFVESL